MAGKRCAISVAVMSMLALAGCCRWCERNCPSCHAPPPAQACVPCCPAPAAAAYPPPVTAAAAPVGQWQRPVQQMNCTCTPSQ